MDESSGHLSFSPNSHICWKNYLATPVRLAFRLYCHFNSKNPATLWRMSHRSERVKSRVCIVTAQPRGSALIVDSFAIPTMRTEGCAYSEWIGTQPKGGWAKRDSGMATAHLGIMVQRARCELGFSSLHSTCITLGKSRPPNLNWELSKYIW